MRLKYPRTVFSITVVLLLALSWMNHGGLSPWLGAGEPVPVPPFYETYYGPPAPFDPVDMPARPAHVIYNSIHAWEGGIEAAPPTVGYYAEGFINEQAEGRMSHVSSLVPLGGDDMAAVWYSGSREGAKDVKIYLSVFTKGRWSHPLPLVSRGSAMRELGTYVRKVGNPLLARDASGRLWLFYASIAVGGWSGSSLNYKVSDDGGISWSDSVKLRLSPFFNLTNNVKNKALALTDGGVLLPAYHEFKGQRSELVRIYPGGRYTRSIMTRSGQAIQPSVVVKGPDRLGAFYRNMSKALPRRVLYNESTDMGRSWSSLMDTTLKNPNAGLDVMDTEFGLIAVLNNLEEDRHRLTLEHSLDGGRTWQELWVLEDTAGREFSYPFLSRSERGLFHLSYTYDRKRIRHIAFDSEWLGMRIREAEGDL